MPKSFTRERAMFNLKYESLESRIPLTGLCDLSLDTITREDVDTLIPLLVGHSSHTSHVCDGLGRTAYNVQFTDPVVFHQGIEHEDATGPGLGDDGECLPGQPAELEPAGFVCRRKTDTDTAFSPRSCAPPVTFAESRPIPALPGDANLDGKFNVTDLVQVLQAGLYETGNAASWSSGDWNCDGVFDRQDLVDALRFNF